MRVGDNEDDSLTYVNQICPLPLLLDADTDWRPYFSTLNRRLFTNDAKEICVILQVDCVKDEEGVTQVTVCISAESIPTPSS